MDDKTRKEIIAVLCEQGRKDLARQIVADAIPPDVLKSAIKNGMMGFWHEAFKQMKVKPRHTTPENKYVEKMEDVMTKLLKKWYQVATNPDIFW